MASQVSPKGERRMPPWTSLVARRQSSSPLLLAGVVVAGAALAVVAPAAKTESLSLVIVLSFALTSRKRKTPTKRPGSGWRTTDLLADCFTWPASRSAQITTLGGA